MTIRPSNIIRPTSVSIIRKSRWPKAVVQSYSLSKKANQRRFAEVISLVSSTRTDQDRSRLDVTKSLVISRSTTYTKNPVPRGNKTTDHSFEDPPTIRFSGIFTETPFIAYSAGDALGLVTRGSLSFYQSDEPASRVQEQLRILQRMRAEREPMFVANSIEPLDNMVITKLVTSKRPDTGAAVVVDIEMQQLDIISEVRREPIPDSLMAQLGLEPIQSATGAS